MDAIVLYIILGIIAVLASAFLIWFKTRGYADLVKNLYQKYKVLIDASGEFIRQQDPELYKEMIELFEALEEACKDDEITRDELIVIYKEGRDVYERVKELLKKKE